MEDKKTIIDLSKIFGILLSKKKTFLIVWIVTVVLSAIWIFPQPRYYNASVILAPEGVGEDVGGLAGIASSFGINLGGSTADAIYPELYPDLMESNSFVVDLLTIGVSTEDGTINTDYYSYLAKHQKQNWLTLPFAKLINSFSSEKKSGPSEDNKLDPFRLSKFDDGIVNLVKGNVKCSVDKKTNVISIIVKDQDPLVCAMLADSVKERLQAFIIDYRTKKSRIDVAHYQQLVDSTRIEYDKAIVEYASFVDSHKNLTDESFIAHQDQLKNDLNLKNQTYTAMCTQLEAMKAKLQERTPAFTTLQGASVPIKPAGPKRMIFIAACLIFVTFAFGVYFLRELFFRP